VTLSPFRGHRDPAASALAGDGGRGARRRGVVLTDDDAEMREVLRSLLAEHADIEVVGDAADGLRKDRLHEELAQALRAMAAGGTCWSAATEAPG